MTMTMLALTRYAESVRRAGKTTSVQQRRLDLHSRVTFGTPTPLCLAKCSKDHRDNQREILLLSLAKVCPFDFLPGRQVWTATEPVRCSHAFRREPVQPEKGEPEKGEPLRENQPRQASFGTSSTTLSAFTSLKLAISCLREQDSA